MFIIRWIKQTNISPCKICANCIIPSWKNIFGGKEKVICCKLKSDVSGDYCPSYRARGSKQCKYKEGTPSIVNDVRCQILGYI